MNVWRDRLSRWFHPLAVKFPFSPNTITISALGLNVLAAGCFYAGGRTPSLFIVGMLIVVVSGLADAFDGIVARAQNKQTRYGDFLDHLADRASDTLLVTGWLFGNSVRVGIVVAAVILVMMNGYIGTQIEATWRERSYDEVGRGEFVLALILYPIVSFTLVSNGWQAVTLSGFSLTEWMTFLMLLFASFGIVQRLQLARTLGRAETRDGGEQS